jgi:hypothetical protein
MVNPFIEAVAAADLHIVIKGSRGSLRGPRHQQGEIEILPRIDGERIDLLIGHHAGHFAPGRVDRRYISRDGDRLLHTAQGKRDIAVELRSDVQHQAGDALDLEARRFRLQFIAPRWDGGKAVPAFGVGHGRALYSGVLVGQGQRCAGNWAALLVLDDAGDLRVAGLGDRRR